MHTVFCVFAGRAVATFALWPPNITMHLLLQRGRQVIRLAVVFIIFKAQATLWPLTACLLLLCQLHQLLAVYITMAACHFGGRDHQQQQQQQENIVLNLMHDHIKRSHMQL